MQQIDVVLVSELSRWGQSIQDLLATLPRLAGWKVSVVTMSGMTSERVSSGLAAAKARGEKLGRQPWPRPKSDKLAPKVLQSVGEGRSYR